MNAARTRRFRLFDFIPQPLTYLLVFFLSCLQIIFWLILQFPSFNIYASGNDSELYHRYATGLINHTSNSWPKILRFLHDVGLYHRGAISFTMFMTTLTVIPSIALKIIDTEAPNLSGGRAHVKKVKTYILLFVVAYPSTFIFSLDLYRDILMLNVLLICLLMVQLFLKVKGAHRYVFLFIFFFLSYVAFGLRAYLGAAIIGSFLSFYFLQWTNVTGKKLIIGGVIFLVISHQMGWLDLLIIYRGEEGFVTGSTTFGIGLVGISTINFVMLVGLSLLYQIAGLYILGPILLFVFLVETLPILAMIRHILRYAKFISPFGYYLLTFLIVYTFIWVIGNDNMGTAMRLRIPTYIGIVILFGCVEIRRVDATFKTISGT